MKKLLASFLLIFFTIFLTGCQGLIPNENFDSLPQIETNADKSSSDNENNTEATNTDNKSDSNSLDSPYNIKDYYPMKANTQYIYEGTGNEFAPIPRTDYIKDNRLAKDGKWRHRHLQGY